MLQAKQQVHELSVSLVDAGLRVAFARLNHEIKKHGISAGMESLVRKAGCDHIVETSPETNQVLANRGCLVITTHPHQKELAYVLAAFNKYKRRDIFVLGATHFGRLGTAIREQLIPMINVIPFEKTFHGRIMRATGFRDLPAGGHKEVFARNTASLEHAVKIMDNGGIVVLFAEGAAIETQAWQGDTGVLVSKMHDNTPIIFAYQSLPERIAAGKSIVTTKFSNPFLPSEAQQESGSTLLVPAQERKTLVKWLRKRYGEQFPQYTKAYGEPDISL